MPCLHIYANLVPENVEISCSVSSISENRKGWPIDRQRKIPETFTGIHAFKTDTSMSAAKTICDTHTHTHPSCLPHSAACCTPGAMSNRRVIPGPRCRVGGTSHHTCQPPKHPGQMVCHTSLEERENTDGTWTAPFGKRQRDTKNTDRQRGLETWSALNPHN